MGRFIKKTLKIMLLSIVSILLILVIGGALFVNMSPEFGGKASAEKRLASKKKPIIKTDYSKT